MLNIGHRITFFFIIFNFNHSCSESIKMIDFELPCYFHWGLWFMHSFLCLSDSVCLGKKEQLTFSVNTQVFNNSVATEGEQWSKHTQQFHFIGADSVLLPGKIWCGSRQVQLFIQALPANGKVCVTNCNEAHKRERKKNKTTTAAQIWNLFWVTEEELNLASRADVC